MNKQLICLLLIITSLTACGSAVYLSASGDAVSNIIVFMNDKKEGTISLDTSTNRGFGMIYFNRWSGPQIMKLYSENRKPIELQVNLKKQHSYYLHYDVNRDEFDWEGTKYSVPPGTVIKIQDANQHDGLCVVEHSEVAPDDEPTSASSESLKDAPHARG